jgi:3-oxoacyl-[acyl-carrier-protein] synthase II
VSKNPNTTGGASPILITGLGAFGAAGRNCEELWESSRGGQSQALRRVFAGQHLPAYVAPEVALARPDAHLVRQAGRAAGLALAAAREAWEQAGLSRGGIDPARVGVIVGSSRGPADVVARSLRPPATRPSEALYTAFSSVAGLLASAFEIHGCAFSVSATCTSGATAMYTARQLLRSGEFDLILAGGVEAPLIDSIVERMSAAGILSSSGSAREALRPFDEGRDGTVLGEGAAFVVMETPESAARRGARVHGQLLAAAVTCESHSRIRPTDDCDGLQRAIRATLPQLSSAGSPVDLIHLHGTGTKLNDQMESACIRTLFGPPKAQPLCWGTKGLTGHTLGASPCFQVILSLLAMRHSFLPGTANCTTQDPLCDIRLSVGNGAPLSIQKALCLTSGFWGKNSALLLGAPDL